MQTTKTFIDWVKNHKFNKKYHYNEYRLISEDLWKRFKYDLNYVNYYKVAEMFYSKTELYGKVSPLYHTHIVTKGIMATFMGNRSLYNDDKIYKFLDMMVTFYNKK